MSMFVISPNLGKIIKFLSLSLSFSVSVPGLAESGECVDDGCCSSVAASSLFSPTGYNWLAGWLGSRGSLTRSLAWSLHSATHKQSYVIAIRHLPPPPPLFSWFYLPHLSCWPLSCSFVLGSHSSVLILLRVQTPKSRNRVCPRGNNNDSKWSEYS